MELNNDFLKQVEPAILAGWDYINADIPGEADNHEAIETTIDANRLTMIGYKDADQLIMQAVKEHGYSKVMKFLVKNIPLV